MGENKRIDSIDALRGLSVILMVIHHFLLDLVLLCGAPEWLFSNWLFTPLHYIFAGTFVFLSGVSSNFSHNNLLRGVKCLAIAFVITFVTTLPFIDEPDRFGVLHLLGFCMVFYGAAKDILDRIPRRVQPVLYLALLVVSALLLNRNNIVDPEGIWGDAAYLLYPFGFMTPGFYSSDYFPIFPWVFVFLLGTWAGVPIKERRLPEKFYTFTCPVLPQIGRKALIIYVVHQPVLYAAILLVRALLGYT